MSIYTKKGDLGQTSNFDGKRKAKTDNLFWLLGELDEFNSRLGVVATQLNDPALKKHIKDVQADVFELCSVVATDAPKNQTWLSPRVEELESLIDAWDNELPQLRNFVLPGADLISANLHLCRVSCRTAERYFFGTFNKELSEVGRYLNRMSDFLFQLTRIYLHQNNLQETIWKPRN